MHNSLCLCVVAVIERDLGGLPPLNKCGTLSRLPFRLVGEILFSLADFVEVRSRLCSFYAKRGIL